MAHVTEIQVNGTRHRIEANLERSLLRVLRDNLDLTGSKYGCGEGRCGACTVVIDGQARRSCVTPLRECTGKPTFTIESLERDGKLHPLQTAFIEVGAMQCGYCTPGMIMAALALLGKNRAPTAQDIAQAMDGNICRCGAYARIVQAIQQAAKASAGGER